jgi:hypothetical protein
MQYTLCEIVSFGIVQVSQLENQKGMYLLASQGNAALPTVGRYQKRLEPAGLTTNGRHKTRTCDLYGVNVAL